MADQTEINFLPSDVDVVSTKLRTWNGKHPGNIFYTELVHKLVQDISVSNDCRSVATAIVNTIMDGRGGRFLKLKDGNKTAPGSSNPTSCVLMGRKCT